MKIMKCYKYDKEAKELLFCRINMNNIIAMYTESDDTHLNTYNALVRTDDGEIYRLNKEDKLTSDKAEYCITSATTEDMFN